MTLSETIDSFTPDKQESLKSSLRDEMGCHEPDCNLALQIAAGSLSVTSILTIPDTAPTAGVNASALVANVSAAATQLVSQSPAALSASLGVPVESTAPVAVQTGVVVPLVVASDLNPSSAGITGTEPGTDPTEIALLGGLGAAAVALILFVAWKLGYFDRGGKTPTSVLRRFSRAHDASNLDPTAAPPLQQPLSAVQMESTSTDPARQAV